MLSLPFPFSVLVVVWFLIQKVEMSSNVKSSLHAGQYGSLVGANLARRDSRHFGFLGARHFRLVCHGFSTHHFHDASSELEGKSRELSWQTSTEEATSGSVREKRPLYPHSLTQCLIHGISSSSTDYVFSILRAG